jgi:hypothetical protein
MKVNTDIDIDVINRDEVLKFFQHIPASIIKDNVVKKHNSGVYLTDIPIDPYTGVASIDYKEAEDLGYFKLDFLNNSLYEGVIDETHLNYLSSKEPLWDLLEHEEIVTQLAHLHNHYSVVKQLKPKSVEQLAAVLAIIRPAKRHLLGSDWETIMNEVWTKPTDDQYYFKKAHAIAYAVSIVVQLNLFCEQVESNGA